MSKKSFCIANWKIYLNNIESINFMKKFTEYKFLNNNCEVVVCPSFTSIPLMVDLVKDKRISMGSQDISIFKKGAYTGDISIDMIEELGCKWTIIGHSERRQFYNETNEIIRNKMKLVYNDSGLSPILCIGESLEEMNSGLTDEIITNQLEISLMDVNFNSKKDLLIAYEPVWAIGTGISADIEVISKNMKIIKDFIENLNTKKCNIYLLYGGSVNENNASEIFELNEVDGFLIGSASTDPDKFYSIYKQF